jgi:catechol 2,3-dioxygenase-like lactoylglutathione lyase family enzyme
MIAAHVSPPALGQAMIDRPIHHIGYVVDDIPRAVDWAVSQLGAGPFFLAAHMPFDEVTYAGQPAAYDHSSAFGQWGAIRLELTEVHSASPPGLADMFGGPTPRIGHVAFLADDLDAETEALEAAGLPLFHTGRSGPIRAHWFDGRSVFGHHVEVLQRSDVLLGLYEMMRTSHEGWDGSDPLREGPGGPLPA